MNVPQAKTARWTNRRKNGDPLAMISYLECAKRALRTYISPPSGYTDLLAALPEKELQPPSSVWQSEVKRAWAVLEAGLLVRASALEAHSMMRSRRKSAKAALKAQSAKAKAAPSGGSGGESSSSSESSSDSPTEAARDFQGNGASEALTKIRSLRLEGRALESFLELAPGTVEGLAQYPTHRLLGPCRVRTVF